MCFSIVKPKYPDMNEFRILDEVRIILKIHNVSELTIGISTI